MTVEGESIGRSGLNAGPVDDVLHIASSPLSPESTKTRFIVEPQVLNAALDSDVGRPLGASGCHPECRIMRSRHTHVCVYAPVQTDSCVFFPVSSPTYQSDIAPGGLHPPPRPSSRKGRPPRSTPSSPATSGEYPNLASFPNTPLSSPYRNSLGAPAVRSPRLSNFLRGDTLLSTLTRRASLEGQGDEYDIKFKEAVGLTAPWSPRDADQADSGSPASPLASLPSSPEMLPTAPADVSGPRSSRQNRYLSGLQKITKLGKAKGSSAGSRFSVAVADASVRSSRRMSDADIDMRSSGSSTNLKKGGGGSEDLSSRYRRMLDRGVRTAGELMKASGSASVPSSPISAAVKSRWFP
ncbi:hypothetical protein BD309DRAFT_946259 [Dichomitus squalens]|nr:hypothetical protein BD309DRAFT_946259 [Dichomitus squalens]